MSQFDDWVLIQLGRSLELCAAVHARGIFIALGLKCAKINVLLLAQISPLLEVELVLIVFMVLSILGELADAGSLGLVVPSKEVFICVQDLLWLSR